MQTRELCVIAIGTCIVGCTALLGDFAVGGAAGGVGDGGGGADGALTDGPTNPTDGPSGDAPHALRCAFLPTSFRKVTDLKNNDAGDQRFDSVTVVSIGDSAARIIPKTAGPSGDTLTVYTLRTDKPGDNPSVSVVANARINEVRHRPAPQGMGDVDILTSPPSGYAVFTLPDGDTNAQLQNPLTLLAPALPGGAQARATILPLAHRDYWGLAEYQPSGSMGTYTVGTFRAMGAAGPLVNSAASGPEAFSTDFINLVRVGDDVYGFNAGDVGSGVPLTQWKWPVTPTASSPGVSRRGIGNGILPIAALPAPNGSAVQMVLGKLALDPNTMTITSIEIATGNIPNASFFSFTYDDLKKATTLSDPDAFSFGPKSAVTAYPGHLAFLGKGGLTTSNGLNFVIVDTAGGRVDFSAVGTGTNLLQGNDRVEVVAMDYAPPRFGTSFGYDVAWIEHVVAGGADYDAIFYQKLQCDP